jgi:NADH-quinone oxidoreductase subunit E
MSVLSEQTRERIRAEFAKYPNKRAATLPALHIVQDEHRQVSSEALREVAELLELHPAEVNDTLSFYGFFRGDSDPLGKNRVWICRSLSCALRGGEELLTEIAARLHVEPGETTADGRVTLEFAECLGGCDGAPCLLVNDECHLNMTAASATKLIEELK